MKRLYLLFLSVVLTCSAKAMPMTWSRVSYVYCNEIWTMIHQAVLTDSTTEITLTLEGKPGTRVRISPRCYVSDEKDNRYLIRRSENLTLGEYEMVNETGKKTFTLIFPALPSKTHSFDLIEDSFLGALRIYGIHDAKESLPLSNLWNGPCKRLPEVDAYKWGEAILKGQIVKPYGKYNPIIDLSVSTLLDPYRKTTALIDPSGQFEVKITKESPSLVRMTSGADFPLFSSYVFLRPGKTTEIQVTDTASTGTAVRYAKDERYAQLLQHIPYWLYYEDGSRLREATFEACDTLLQLYERRNRSLANYLAMKYRLGEDECALLRTWVEMTTLSSRLNVARDRTNQEYRRDIGNPDFVSLPPTIAQIYDRVYNFLAEEPLDNPNYGLIELGAFATEELVNIMPISRAMNRVFEKRNGMRVTEHAEMERILQLCLAQDSVLRSICHYDRTPVMVQAAIAGYFFVEGNGLTQEERRKAVDALSGIITDKALCKRMHFYAETGYKVDLSADKPAEELGKQTQTLVQRLFPDVTGKVVHIVGFGTGQGNLLNHIDNLIYDFKNSPDVVICFVTREGALSQKDFEQIKTGTLGGTVYCLRLSDEDYFRLMYAAHGSGTFQLTLDGKGNKVSPLNITDEYNFRKNLRILLNNKINIR